MNISYGILQGLVLSFDGEAFVYFLPVEWSFEYPIVDDGSAPQLLMMIILLVFVRQPIQLKCMHKVASGSMCTVMLGLRDWAGYLFPNRT